MVPGKKLLDETILSVLERANGPLRRGEIHRLVCDTLNHIPEEKISYFWMEALVDQLASVKLIRKSGSFFAAIPRDDFNPLLPVIGYDIDQFWSKANTEGAVREFYRIILETLEWKQMNLPERSLHDVLAILYHIPSDGIGDKMWEPVGVFELVCFIRGAREMELNTLAPFASDLMVELQKLGWMRDTSINSENEPEEGDISRSAESLMLRHRAAVEDHNSLYPMMHSYIERFLPLLRRRASIHPHYSPPERFD